jgi:adenine phosphoribosyltransferase
MPVRLDKDLGPANSIKLVDGVGLFDCEMYMSGMHGGHGSGKTSSFKRCLFLKNIGQEEIVQLLVAAFETCPTPLCYVHLLHGGGAVRDIKTDDTAFGTRDWDYACIVTGVWPRESDQADVSGTAVRWVYTVARSLLPFSTGVYGADLGPDPRDASLATMAFGLNGPRLADLKRRCDPHSVLAYACPVPRIPSVVILVTGQSCSGKDYCANIWASVLNANANKAFTARIASISDATKRAYALATGCDLDLLLHDRAYKEEHRSRLTAFYQRQVDFRDELPKKHFLSVVSGTADADVLFITGMRDEAPIAVFSPLVPNTRLIEITIRVTEELRQARRGSSRNGVLTSDEAPLDYHPSFVFHNDENGSEAAENFAERWLNPFFDKELRRLADMVRLVPDFPCAGVDFRHVLNIAQRHGGLKLCTSLLRTHFTGDWSKVDYIACCQTGGFVFGPALSMQIGVPMALIREGGKLPPPVTSVPRRTSHISSVMSTEVLGKCFEMEKGLLSREMSVVVVDDVLASGHTLCAMLQLLNQAGISTEKIHVMVVAEFPAHSGRRSLRDRGFGSVKVQSLLVFSGH